MEARRGVERAGPGTDVGAVRTGRASDGAQAIERLDRYVLVVIPRQPLVAWVRGLGRMHGTGSGEDFDLEEARAYHRTAYLVPYSEDPHDVEEWIEGNFDLVFEQELFGFTSERRRWPRKRTFERFLDWFDLDLLDAPIDLVDAPLSLPPADDGGSA